MKIASFHSGLDIKRGSSLAFLEICKQLAARGHEVSVHTFSLDGWFKSRFGESSIPALEVPFEPLRPMGINMITSNNRRARGAFRKLAPTFERADAAYLHGTTLTPLFLPVLDMPTLYYCDEPPRQYHEPDLVNTTFRKRLGKALGYFSRRSDREADLRSVVEATVVVTNSEYTRDYIKRVYGVDATTVYSGVDSQVFTPGPFEEKEDMVMSVGAVYPLKGHDFIVRSLARVEEGRRPRLVVVGSGYQQGHLEDLASSSGVEMEVVSDIGIPRLVDLYRRAKLTLVAYVREPFGLVAVESMACGTPVVAVGEGGLLESVTGETGVLTRRDEVEFARTVEDLLADGDRRREMGLKGRSRAEEVFNWKTTGTGIEALLERAIERHGKDGGA